MLIKRYIFILMLILTISCDTEEEVLGNPNIKEGIPVVNGPGTEDFIYENNTVSINRSKDNENLIVDQTIINRRGSINYKSKKITTEFFFLNKGIEGDELIEAKSDLKNEQLFYFDFEESSGENILKKHFKDDLTEPISYMSFGIVEDFKIINNAGDTINAIYATYENSSHISPYERLVLSFPTTDLEGEFELLYSDKLFKQGEISFNFPSAEEIEKNINKVL